MVRARRNCDKLFSKWKKSQTLVNKEKHVEARNAYQRMLRDKKISYYKDQTASGFDHNKLFWEFYQSTIRIRSDKSGYRGVCSLNYNGEKLSETSDIAGAFNKHFSSFESEKDVSDKDCDSFILRNFKNINLKLPSKEFEFYKTNAVEVLSYLKLIKNDSSPGVSGIEVKILKAAAPSIAEPIADLINCCIDSGHFPNEWKIAIVTPLYKRKGDESDPNNYRGISVLPPLCKLVEKILGNQIRSYFIENKLLFQGQHGFISNHSCETALHEVISTCLKNLDEKLLNLLLFIDFKKAFDMVDPRLLFQKLLNYGFGNLALKLIKSYFSNRYQRTKLGEFTSDLVNLILGVPQGSVLGPLFFLIFINDLPFFLANIISILFADDTTLLFAGQDLQRTISMLKAGLKQLNEWCKHNRLYINWSKTYIMIISNKRFQMPKCIDFENTSIEVVETFKLLGVTIDNKLTFNAFASIQCNQINKKMYTIKRLLYLPFEVKIQFFKTFLLPYFDYCISLLIYYQKSAIQRLSKMFYLCLNKLFNVSFLDQTHDEINCFLSNYNISSFHHRFIERVLSFLHKIIYVKNSPTQLKNWIRPTILSNNQYALRSNQKTVFQTYRSNSKFGDITFQNFFSKFLNDVDFVNCFDKNFLVFQKQLDSMKISSVIKIIFKLANKFDTHVNFYFYFEKKKNTEKT